MTVFFLIEKVNRNKQSEIKSNETCANETVFFLIFHVAHCLNGF